MGNVLLGHGGARGAHGLERKAAIHYYLALVLNAWLFHDLKGPNIRNLTLCRHATRGMPVFNGRNTYYSCDL